MHHSGSTCSILSANLSSCALNVNRSIRPCIASYPNVQCYVAKRRPLGNMYVASSASRVTLQHPSQAPPQGARQPRASAGFDVLHKTILERSIYVTRCIGRQTVPQPKLPHAQLLHTTETGSLRSTTPTTVDAMIGTNCLVPISCA